MDAILQPVLIAFVGGVVPAILWLWFWLKEDESHPEPSHLISLTFFYGMLAVPVALVFQIIINTFVLDNTAIELALVQIPKTAIITIITWALVEEVVKYLAAKNAALKKRANDEPMDVLIYMITAALGFAAFENALFLIAPLLDGDIPSAFITGNLRFIGATLVHVASSAIIGVFMAWSYFFKNELKKRYLFGGFILSVTLHTLFNLFIISYQESIFYVFSIVWITVVILIFHFERIKKIHLNKINS